MTRVFAAGLVALVAAGIPSSLRGKEVERLPTHRKVVILTLDAGGDAVHAHSILRTLARKHAVATFFLTGRWVNEHPTLAREIGRRYPVANHSYSHPHMTTLSDSAVLHEIKRAEGAIRRRTGHDPRPLFRFPYGDSDARVIRIANDAGYIDFRWTVDTLGWMGTESVGTAVHRVVRGLEPGEIVLMHVGSAGDGRTTIDTRALPRVIDAVRRHGYKLGTLERYR